MSPHRWLLAVISRLVPRPVRDEWTREWVAELDHREAALNARPGGRAHPRARLLRDTTGAIWDAIWLRTSRWQAARALAHHAGISVAIVVSLGAAMGATTAAGSLYDALLLRTPGIQSPGQVLTIYARSPTNAFDTFSTEDLNWFRTRSRQFSDLALFSDGVSTYAAPDLHERLVGMVVSGNYFDLLGVHARLGTLAFPGPIGTPSEFVVISEALWRRLGADPAIIGRPFRLERATWTVLGVVPASFTGMNMVWRTDVWIPDGSGARLAGLPPTPPDRLDRSGVMIGRLAAGVVREQADAELSSLAAQLAKQYPDSDKDRRTITAETTTIPASLRGWTAPVLVTLLALALLTLVAAASNAANLLLGLALTRRHEMLVRSALGGSRWQLMSPLMRESILLAAAAGLAGVLGAFAALAALSSQGLSLGPEIPRVIFDVRPGFILTAVCGIGAIFAGVAVGAAPAWRAASEGLHGALHRELTRPGRNRLRSALILVQTTIATVVLIGVAVAWRSTANLRNIDLGFTARHLVIADTSVPPRVRPAAGRDLYERWRRAARAVPGVEAVTLASGAPLDSCCERAGIRGEDGAESGRDVVPFAIVDDDYFATLGIPLEGGRTFDAQDAPRAPEVVIINATLANRRWPHETAVGRRLRIDSGNRLVEIVGVAGDGKYENLDEAPQPMLYYALRQHYLPDVAILVRTAVTSPAMTRTVGQAVTSVDRTLDFRVVRPLQDVLDLELIFPTLLADGLSGLGALALLLSVVGLYSTVFYAVGQRRREIGIRLALGAQLRQVLTLALRHTVLVVTAGALVGVAVAQFSMPLVASTFPGLRPVEGDLLAGAAVFTVTISTLVGYTAARRWTRGSAVEILRG